MKKLTTIYLFSYVFLLFSCQEPPSVDDNFTLKLDESILIDGVDRAYHIQQPDETFNKPLVVLLHGHGGSSDQSLGLESSKAAQKVWLDIAKEEDFILVVPNGELGPEDSRGWNDCYCGI